MEYDCLGCGYTKREKLPRQCPQCWSYDLLMKKPKVPVGVGLDALRDARAKLLRAHPVSLEDVMDVFRDLGLQ